jgi:multidrug efflux pump subunit AcrB
MWLIRAAMRRPITILIVIVGVALMSLLAVQRMKIDIFPDLGTPVIYVAQPYGGMDPAQMEGYIANYYEYHFLYVTGIEHVESRSIQGATLLKLFFHEGTNMSQAVAETVAQVNRSRAFMPPGTVPPFVVRFDGGSVPVGYLVFSSETRALGEIQDLALNRVRPMFGTLPGVSAPPPFGGNQRTVVVRVDPDRLRAYRMSGEEVVRSLSRGNVVTPSGNVRIGDFTQMVPVNSVVRNVQELLEIPVRVGAGPSVFLRDIGYVEDSSDILTSYALINGKRSVYIPVTKRADASATFAEQYRREGAAADAAATRGATSRLRPILMTTFAMIAGMIPVAVGAEQVAPLGRAVIGGLAASTVATLLVLPVLFALVQARATVASPSLDPDDVMSRHHSGEGA